MHRLLDFAHHNAVELKKRMCVCVCVSTVNCAKMAELIEMLFWVLTRVSKKPVVLHEVKIPMGTGTMADFDPLGLSAAQYTTKGILLFVNASVTVRMLPPSSGCHLKSYPM